MTDTIETPEVVATEAKKYLGERLVVDRKGDDVIFEDGSYETLNELQQSYMITEEPLDTAKFEELIITFISNNVWRIISESNINDVVNLAAKILKVYEEHNIKNVQVDQIGLKVMYKMREIMDTVARSYMKGFQEALGKAFGTYKEGLPTEYYMENIRVSDIARLKN